MIPAAFDYKAPTSLNEALQLLDRGDPVFELPGK